MASKTFQVGAHRVTVRTVKQQRPGGLANIGWEESGVDVTVKIDNITDLRCGTIYTLATGYAVSLGSNKKYGIAHLNNIRHRQLHVKTQQEAFEQLCEYIRKEMLNANTNNGTSQAG